MATHTTDAVKGLKFSISITELCSIPRFCKVFSCFVPDSGWIAALLSRKLKKDRPKHFEALTDEELRALYKLQKKTGFTSSTHANERKRKYLLDTNAYNVQVECVFLHEQPDGTGRLVGYG